MACPDRVCVLPHHGDPRLDELTHGDLVEADQGDLVGQRGLLQGQQDTAT